MPKSVIDHVIKVVKLIRSKGVGVYFVTQNPTDIPESILGQCGNKVQHALRAFTPKDQKAVKTAADTFRANPELDTYEAIMTLSTGEALVSFLDEKGRPSIVQRAKILFPLSQIGAISDSQRETIIKQSNIYGKYDTPIDRESAFEVLIEEAEKTLKEEEEAKAVEEAEKEEAKAEKKGGKKKGWISAIFSAVIAAILSSFGRSVATEVSNKVTGKKSKSGGVKGAVGRATKSATTTVVNKITRDILGNLIK